MTKQNAPVQKVGPGVNGGGETNSQVEEEGMGERRGSKVLVRLSLFEATRGKRGVIPLMGRGLTGNK